MAPDLCGIIHHDDTLGRGSKPDRGNDFNIHYLHSDHGHDSANDVRSNRCLDLLLLPGVSRGYPIGRGDGAVDNRREVYDF